jgi:hypothetical protein
MYDMCMPVLDEWTWLREDVPGLVLTNVDVNLLTGVGCDTLSQDFFFGSPTKKNSRVKRVWSGEILG